MNKHDDIRIQEGFSNQRLVVNPSSVLHRCRQLPLVEQLHVTDIGMYPAASHHYVERRGGIADVILIYCLSGKGRLEIDNTIHSVGQGHVVLIPPWTPHVYRADDADPWSIYWVHFAGTQAAAALRSLHVCRTSPLLYVPDTRLMRDAFEEVFATLKYHYSDAGLLAMTSELLRLIAAVKLHQGHSRRQRQGVEDRVLATQSFMERHLDMRLRLKELAALSGQSVPYYSRLFKERTNQSPMDWFIQRKIQKACELLDQTDLTIRHIAERVGYDDPYYFSRIFKRIQGRSPAQYRALVKG